MHLVGLYTNCNMIHGTYNVKFSLPVWQNITGYFDIIQLKIVTYLLHWYFESLSGVIILISLHMKCQNFLISKLLQLVRACKQLRHKVVYITCEVIMVLWWKVTSNLNSLLQCLLSWRTPLFNCFVISSSLEARKGIINDGLISYSLLCLRHV